MDVRRRTVFLLVSAMIMVACPTWVQAGCCCPTFWTAFYGHCYRLFSNNFTWRDAEMFCQSYTVPSLGDGQASRDSLGHLVSVHSQTEQYFIETLWESSRKKDDSNNEGLWIGIHDVSIEGEYHWSDGSPIDFTNWAPGQPDASTVVSDCGVIRSSSPYGQWRDGPCVQDIGAVHYYICKLPMW